MSNRRDIARAQQGKDIWNAWAEENPGIGVDFHEADFKQIDFAGFVFPGAVDFASALLDADASFKDTEFCDTANFENTSFMGSGDFHGATFKGEATFHNVRFHRGGARFNGAIFEGHANFLSAHFENGSAAFNGTTFLQDANFAEAKFSQAAIFSGARFGKLTNFHAARFSGDASFQKTIFSDCSTHFDNATFGKISDFSGASFGKEGADFLGTSFRQSAIFDEAHFAGNVIFRRAEFVGVAAFRSTTLRGLVAFDDAQFTTSAVFKNSAFESVPTFHGAKLHEDTTFEAVTWPKRPHEDQSPYDAVRAWARLRVEMNRLHKHEDELSFFAKELNARAHDWHNESLAKRLLYRSYLALGAGRSVARPFGWLVGLNAVLFLPIYWYATSAIQWCNLSIRDILASFNIPADVVSFTLGQALPLIGGSNPERADLYKRLFPSSDSSGIDVPLWLEFVAIFQQLAGIALLFLIGLALRNRFRMK